MHWFVTAEQTERPGDELGRVSVGGDDGAQRILCATLAYANRAEK
jgi:hypothetical protein